MNSEPTPGTSGSGAQRVDCITAAPLAALSATLDRDDPAPRPGDPLPPPAHWLYFTPLARASEIGPDGHARSGGLLPPAPLPRRMWAGGRLQFLHPLRVGDEITRNSRIADIKVKSGRSGTLVFVTVHHAIANAQGVALTEEHDTSFVICRRRMLRPPRRRRRRPTKPLRARSCPTRCCYSATRR